MSLRLHFFYVVTFWVILYLAGCAASKDGFDSPEAEEETATVYVTKRGWHTCILFEKMAADTLFPDLIRDFPAARFLEVSWGDRKYFMAEKGTLILALRAALLPTQSVLHVDGYSRLPDWFFRSSQVNALELSSKGFQTMIRSIRSDFARDSLDNLISLREDRESMSFFYLADKKYWGTRTCNVWTARKLREAGGPVRPFFALTANGLLNQLEKIGKKKKK